MKKSTHKAIVVPIILEKHPNADTLSLCKVFDGYTCVVKTADWLNIKRGVFIPPDSLVDVAKPEFKFLEKEAKYNENSYKGKQFARVTAKKLRGIISYGLLIPAPGFSNIEDNLAEYYEIKHFEPPINAQENKLYCMIGGEVAKPPTGFFPKYDVDSFLRYGKMVFTEGESVSISEKIHGASGKYVYQNNQFYCGSRTEFKKEYAVPPIYNKIELENKLGKEKATDIILKLEEKIANWKPKRNMWWQALHQDENLQKFLKDNENVAIYGEVIGCQDFRYNLKPSEIDFYVFDIMKNGKWINVQEAREFGKNLKWVPLLYDNFPFKFDELIKLSQRNSVLNNNQIAEGIVVKPILEREHFTIGRVQLKIINPDYLIR